MDEATAKAEWDAHKDGSPGVLNLPGDVKRVAVMEDPTVGVEVARQVGQRFEAAAAVTNRAEANTALASLGGVGQDRGQLVPEAFGPAANLFRPGTLQGTSSGQVMPFGMMRATPGLASVAQPDDFQGLVPPHQLSPEEQASLVSPVSWLASLDKFTRRA